MTTRTTIRRTLLLATLAAALALAAAFLPGLWPTPWTSPSLTTPPANAAHTLIVLGVSITSSPANGTSYAAGESITVRVTFGSNITSHSNGALAINIGGTNRSATPTGFSCGSNITYSYTVVAADSDSDGIVIASNALSGTYRSHLVTSQCPSSPLEHSAATPTIPDSINCCETAQANHLVGIITDYDTDNDGLIEITTLEQLQAVEADPDGDGAPVELSYYTGSEVADYNAAFPNRQTTTPGRNGCSPGGTAGACSGYELMNDLTYDTNGDGQITSPADTYTSFQPLGNQFSWTTIFDGNGHTISYLRPTAGQPNHAMFSYAISGAHIRNLGLDNFAMSNSQSQAEQGALVGRLSSGATVSNCWAAGTIESTHSTAANKIGGLVGELNGGTIRSSYANVAVSVHTTNQNIAAGGLVGHMVSGNIHGSYATGAVSGGGDSGNARAGLGGLAGVQSAGVIAASYATGAVSDNDGIIAGGLVGLQAGGAITASYATGAVTTGASGFAAGLVPSPTSTLSAGGIAASGSGTITNSYWDTTTSGIAATASANRGVGHTTTALQSPTNYTGIYAGWNITADGGDTADDPWDFGTSSQYPLPKYGASLAQVYTRRGATAPAPTTDYDSDDDNLIEISTLAQLNAVRYDLDGSGDDGLTGNHHTNYHLAFPGALPGMGCAAGPGMCEGYELAADLDFAGTHWTANGGGHGAPVSGVGIGWVPIGSPYADNTGNADYAGDFKGNGHTISNLYINVIGTNTAPRIEHAGLFRVFSNGTGDSVIDGVGLLDVDVTLTKTGDTGDRIIVAGALASGCTCYLYNSYATGRVAYNATGSAARGEIGGLLGVVNPGSTLAGIWSGVDVINNSASTSSTWSDSVGGITGVMNDADMVASYATGHVSAPGGRTYLGGLSGWTQTGSTVTASYAAGTYHLGANPMGVTVTNVAHPLGIQFNATNSYYSTDTYGTVASTPGTAHTTAQLQAPTEYGSSTPAPGSIYADWNVDVDNADDNDDPTDGEDDPWQFGNANQYPILKFGYDADAQALQTAYHARPPRIDYDADDDGLIDITTLAQLELVRYDLDGAGWGPGRYAQRVAAFPNARGALGCPAAGCSGYELAADLDFAGSQWATGAGWTPIGVDAASGVATPYAATFDGNYRTISNLFINLTTTTNAGGSFVGLFGDVTGAVRNVGLVAPNITNTRSGGGFARTGALAGRLDAGNSLTNSWVSGGTVTVSQSTGIAQNYVGCLLGWNGATVRGSWASCAVSGTASTDNATSGVNAGGLVGGGNHITGSYATGTVTGAGTASLNIGGLVGFATSSDITSSYATGAVTSTGTGNLGNAGGLVGALSGGSIKASFATGAVSIADNQDVGGLIGDARLTGTNVIEAVYATGSVARNGAAGGGNAGGLIGDLNAATGTSVTAAYSIGAVTNADTTTPGAVGGLVAAVATGTGQNATPISQSYWNNQGSGQGGSGQTTSAGTTGATNYSGQTGSALQMPTSYTGIYANWNLNIDDDTNTGAMTTGADNPWQFRAASQYPILTYGFGPYAVSLQHTNTVGATDYDLDDDNLIDIGNAGNIAGLRQLHALRYDPNGVGPALTGPNALSYITTGFSTPAPRMGCRTVCQGYELTADLDFDSNGDGTVGAGDAYSNWTPISDYQSVLNGQGHTISNLTISGNIYRSGLFAQLNQARVERLGLLQVNINITRAAASWIESGPLAAVSSTSTIISTYATGQLLATTGTGSSQVVAGGLVGILGPGAAGPPVVPSQLVASWADVAVTTTSGATPGDSNPDRVGGLVGEITTAANAAPAIIASYAAGAATANTTATGLGASVTRCAVGGLAGRMAASSITASYSTGAPSCTAASGDTDVGAFIGQRLASTTITDAYWNTGTVGSITDAVGDGAITGITGRSTAVLQAPTEYGTTTNNDIYADWNVNLDGDTTTGTPTVGGDDPWDFGTSSQYPILKYGHNALGRNMQRHTEYDSDGDGLLEITTPAQLDAVRHDLNGNGDAVINIATRAAYLTAFPNHGRCLTTACAGYELAADLDLAGYANWEPIGPYTTASGTVTFQGNSRTISNLTITDAPGTGSESVGLFSALGANAVVESVGLVNVSIADSASSITTGDTFHAGALAGASAGTVRYSYATGTLATTVSGTAGEQILTRTGGLVGNISGGVLSASWADVTVSLSSDSAGGGLSDAAGGLVGRAAGSSTTLASFAMGNVTADSDSAFIGGLIGYADNSTVTATYSIGQPTGTGTTPSVGGLIGSSNSATVTANSYWDTASSLVSSSAGGPTVIARTTTQLQSPNAYGAQTTDMYPSASWNANVDGDTTTGDGSGNDDPWHFGTNIQYPTLVFNHDIRSIRAQRRETAGTDYDTDDDGLIDISGGSAGLHQLNALRLDPDGSGEDGITGRDAATYLSAFPGLAANMGCPTATGCTGYELTANLDFDSDGDGDVDSSDLFDGNWTPLPDYDATFQGNGHTIRNLTINSSAASNTGLFGITGPDAVIISLGLRSATVTGMGQTGILAGRLRGTAAAVWSSGSVTGTQEVGGLVGVIGTTAGEGAVTASYSRATVTATADGISDVGGLVGRVFGSLNYSYSIGPVSATGTSAGQGGVVGVLDSGTVQASYWDTTSSGLASADSNTITGVTGLTIDQLQAPTAYGSGMNDIYADWNVDVDNADANDDLTNGVDDPWDFGAANEYPVLKFGFSAAAITAQRPIDYDRDNDDLIEITTAAQLNAIRWDLDGDGVHDIANNQADYQAAFPNAIANLGCTSSTTPGVCGGYELAADLDLSGYANWTPLGGTYSSTFDGNGHTISNLTITDANISTVGLFGTLGNGVEVKSVGLLNVNIADSYTTTNAGFANFNVGALAGYSTGTVRYVYATGRISTTVAGTPGELAVSRVGGLVGLLAGSSGAGISASWADVDIAISSDSTSATSDLAGGLAGEVGGNAAIIASYAKGDVTADRGTPALGGLAGRVDSQENPGINAAYSTGAPTVSGTAATTLVGGLIGSTGTANVNASYWDTETSGVSTADSPAITNVTGQTTTALQTPTEYGSGIYTAWNVNVDGTSGNDDPWHFGGATDYPILQFRHNAGSISRQMGVEPTTDYDQDDDGLIDIDSLAKLNAIRYDLDGDGAATGADIPNYLAGFAGPLTGMGCPTTTGCTGYELTANLNFDTNDDGMVDADDAALAWGGGSGWDPIGDATSNRYDAIFDGNGHTIANLFINRASDNRIGLFGYAGADSHLTRVGLPDVTVTANDYVGALVGDTQGRVSFSWVTGEVAANGIIGMLVGANTGPVTSSWAAGQVTGAGAGTGGLIGNAGGSVTATYSHTRVMGNDIVGGLIGQATGGRITASYAAGRTTNTGTDLGGLLGRPWSGFNSATDIVNSYYDSETTGVTGGETTANLRGTLGYTGIYANWNVDVDGDLANTPDSPWDFGTNLQYPILRYGHSPVSIALQRALQDASLRTVAGTNVERIRKPTDTTYVLEIQPPVTDVTLTLTPTNADAVAAVTAVTHSANAPDPDWMSSDGLAIPLTTAGTDETTTVTARVTAPNGVNTREYTLTIQRIFCPKAEVNGPTGVVGEGGSADFTVLVCGLTESPVTVSWAVDTDASTAEPNDVGIAFTGTITVPAGDDQTATLSFPITDDPDAEPSETLTVIITAVSGGTDRIERRPATATIALSDPTLNLRAPEGTGAGGPADGQDTPLNAQTMLVLMEGQGNTYTMRMANPPGESVTVVIHSNHASITTTPDRVTFTAGNYQTPQRITINAAPDGDDKNERATLTHILTDDEGGLIEIIDQIPLFIADTDPPEDDDIC